MPTLLTEVPTPIPVPEIPNAKELLTAPLASPRLPADAERTVLAALAALEFAVAKLADHKLLTRRALTFYRRHLYRALMLVPRGLRVLHFATKARNMPGLDRTLADGAVAIIRDDARWTEYKAEMMRGGDDGV